MSISLNREQLRHLLVLAHIGEWVINADHRDGEPQEDYLRLLTHLCREAAEAGLSDMVERDPDDGKFYPSPKLEETAAQFIDEYDNNTFWEELITRMAERDLIRRHGEQQVSSLSDEDRQVMLAPLKEQYHAEFYANGLDSVVISNRNLN